MKLFTLVVLVLMTMTFGVDIYGDFENHRGFTMEEIINLLGHDEAVGFQRTYRLGDGPETQSWNIDSFRRELEELADSASRNPVHNFTQNHVCFVCF